MTQQEFEDRTNRKVTETEFDYINRIYMAAGEINKDDFCKAWLALAGPKKNVLLDALAEHCEQLARTVDQYHKAILDQALQLDAARENMSKMQRNIDGQKDQIAIRDEMIHKMQKVLYAVEEHVDLDVETEVANAYEEQYGKLYLIRMRHENGWGLNSDEVDWLLDHVEE